MEKTRAKSKKLTLTYIGDQLDFSSNSENNFLKSAKMMLIF